MLGAGSRNADDIRRVRLGFQGMVMGLYTDDNENT